MKNFELLLHIEKLRTEQNTLYRLIGKYRSLPKAISMSVRQEAEDLDQEILKIEDKLKARL